MSLFVLDTDTLTLFEREHATVVARIAEHSPSEIAISVVTVEEQLSGWYTQLRQAKRPERLAWAYRQLAATVRFSAVVRPEYSFPTAQGVCRGGCGNELS